LTSVQGHWRPNGEGIRLFNIVVTGQEYSCNSCRREFHVDSLKKEGAFLENGFCVAATQKEKTIQVEVGYTFSSSIRKRRRMYHVWFSLFMPTSFHAACHFDVASSVRDTIVS
jgi:hypothetical protein